MFRRIQIRKKGKNFRPVITRHRMVKKFGSISKGYSLFSCGSYVESPHIKHKKVGLPKTGLRWSSSLSQTETAYIDGKYHEFKTAPKYTHGCIGRKSSKIENPKRYTRNRVSTDDYLNDNW